MRGGGGSLASRFFRAFQSSYLPAACARASTPFVPLANIQTTATATTAAALTNSHSVSRLTSFLSNFPLQPPPQSSPRSPPHYSTVAVSSRSFCTSSPLAQSLLTRGLAPAPSQQHVAVYEPISASRLVIARGFAKRAKKWRGDPWVMVKVPQGAEQMPASQPNAGSVGGRNQRHRMLQRQLFIKVGVGGWGSWGRGDGVVWVSGWVHGWLGVLQPNAGSVGGTNQRHRMLQRQLFIKVCVCVVGGVSLWVGGSVGGQAGGQAGWWVGNGPRDEERRARWKAGAARAREWRERQLAAAAAAGAAGTAGGGEGAGATV
ncbi:unnamed protein product [Closterium sp. NIES-53]